MLSLPLTVLCAVLGLLLWAGSGYALARRLGFGRALALPMAPALGWAAQNVVALALSLAFGFSVATIFGAFALLCGALLLRAPHSPDASDKAAKMPWWVYAAAVLVAVIPALAVLPKAAGDGIVLAAAIFDHSKIALIDEIRRSGVPAVNPFYGPAGEMAEVSYYYLWHFGAAQLAHLAGATGWEADAAATWFTAFSTSMLMAGLALRLSGSRLAPIIAVALSATGSLRPVIEALFGADLELVLRPASGFAGWLFQSSWSPHHMASAGCLVIAVLLMTRLARRPTILVTLALALVVAAAFESSIWVGGVVMMLTALVLAPLLLRATTIAGWGRLLLAAGGAGLLAAALVSPFLFAQYHAALQRGGGSPVTIMPFEVLGPIAAGSFGRAANLAAYWFVLLVVEFPLIYVAGALMLARLMADRGECERRRIDLWPLSAMAATSLMASWLLVSTVGDNNDLGWRAVLPGLLVLTAAAAAGLARAIETRSRLTMGIALSAFAATVPAGVDIFWGNAYGEPSPSAESFTRAPAMWAAVRRHVPADARVANNPALFADMTPWPVNISWALLADRRSCFAGDELAIAFAPLTRERRNVLAGRFLDVFAGRGAPEDIRDMAQIYDCRAVLLSALDPAWSRDPFAASPFYRLVETEPDAWRIYIAATPASAAP